VPASVPGELVAVETEPVVIEVVEIIAVEAVTVVSNEAPATVESESSTEQAE
jgi:hypothetical protein